MVKSGRITAIKGFHDILPGESARWRFVEEEAVEVFSRYAFKEIRLPIAEKTELFTRSIGTATDIVEKEMYTFNDRGGTSITLRPEATASVVRAAIEHGLVAPDHEQRLFYCGPMFRSERPQKGRFRQFYQIGAEVLGREDPVIDAEIILLLRDLLLRVGARGVTFELNSLGDSRCRPVYRENLRSFASARRDRLCGNCQQRLEGNTLRVLDCKQPQCREELAGAPLVIDHLCEACADHLSGLRRLLDAAGVPVVVNPRIVRGLDYYCRTAFEITAEGLGSQNAVGGGGRYDDLVSALGGPAVAGIGFAVGIERLLLAMGTRAPKPEPPTVFIAPLGEQACARGLAVATELRAAGHRVELPAGGRRLRALMKQADRTGARHVLIIGAEELASGRGTVRDMERKEDHPLSVDLGATGGVLAAQIRQLGGAGT